MSVKDHWEEVTEQEWQLCSTGALWILTGAAAYVLWQHLFTADRWVPLLDHATLAIHEAGHPIVGIFSSRLAVYGGTVFQLLFPLLFMHHFWRQRQSLGFAASGLWLGASLLNVARYMKDARAQQLPLVGGGNYDWTEIFGRWHVLGSDERIGGLFGFLGACTCLAAIAWLWIKSREGR